LASQSALPTPGTEALTSTVTGQDGEPLIGTYLVQLPKLITVKFLTSFYNDGITLPCIRRICADGHHAAWRLQQEYRPSEPDFSDPRGRQLNSLVDNVIGPANDVLVSRSGELLTAT
jgi:hypothetical protein